MDTLLSAGTCHAFRNIQTTKAGQFDTYIWLFKCEKLPILCVFPKNLVAPARRCPWTLLECWLWAMQSVYFDVRAHQMPGAIMKGDLKKKQNGLCYPSDQSKLSAPMSLLRSGCFSNPIKEGVRMRFVLAAAIVVASCLASQSALAAEPDQVKPDQVVVPDQVKPDQVIPDQVKPDQVIPDQVKPDQVKPDQVKPDQVKPDQVKPDQVKPDQVCCHKPCVPPHRHVRRVGWRLRK